MTKRIGIIGAGPGGYVAAIRAAQLGAKVYLIEKDKLGGTCLNRGCIPTKTYYNDAVTMSKLRNSEELGIRLGDFKLDGKKLKERKDKVVDDLVGGIRRIINSYENIEYIEAMANIIDTNKIEVNKDGKIDYIEVDNIIIATGSVPTKTETKGLDSQGVIDSDDLLEMEEIPERLLVIGGGVIGTEFASIYQELGSQVTLLVSTILRGSDSEMGRRLMPMLRKQGVNVYLDIRASEVKRLNGELKVIAKYKDTDETEEILTDYVLVATGRGPVYDGLNLDILGLEYDNKKIKVDENFKTNIDNIYAIGDIIGGEPLAHVASAEGVYAAEHIMGLNPEINLEIIPKTVFAFPELSSVGKTEDELKEEGIDYKTSKFMVGANGKALTMGEKDGLIKILADQDNNILGGHILSVNSSDLIGEITLAMANGLKTSDIGKTIHVHPSLSEIIYEASLGIEGKAIHMEKPRTRRRR